MPYSRAYHSRDTDPESMYEGHSYYEYHHGSGDHVLRRGGYGGDIPVKPQYSLKCLCCHCLDTIILLAVLAFLGFSLYIAYYVLNNYGGG